MQTSLERQPDGKAISNRILVVDDYEDAVDVIKAALERIGYCVKTATDGRIALEVAQTFKPYIALLDVAMPGMDGYELARRLREAQDEAYDLHLVAVTGHGTASDRERSTAAGFEEHLVKPVDLSSLKRMVRKYDQSHDVA